MKFHIDLKVCGIYGMNKYYSGTHWTKRKKTADEIHQLVACELLRQKVKRKEMRPVEITLKYNSRLDLDNHGVLTKMIIDGMKGYLIKDDSRKYVHRITQEFWDGEGIEVEVIDPRALVPLDMETIVDSVKKTSRAAIVEEGCRTGGAGAEIAARIVEMAFDYQDTAVRRIAGVDTPIPYSRVLEEAAVPSQEDIAREIREMVTGIRKQER